MSDEKAVVPGAQVGDRVVMLSLGKDGVPDQNQPTIIGDRETALELTRTQLRQQTASNAHAEADRASGGDLPPQDVEDPEIQARKDLNEKAITSADAAAESLVNGLFSDEGKPAASSVDAAKPTPRAPKPQ